MTNQVDEANIGIQGGVSESDFPYKLYLGKKALIEYVAHYQDYPSVRGLAFALIASLDYNTNLPYISVHVASVEHKVASVIGPSDPDSPHDGFMDFLGSKLWRAINMGNGVWQFHMTADEYEGMLDYDFAHQFGREIPFLPVASDHLAQFSDALNLMRQKEQPQD